MTDSPRSIARAAHALLLYGCLLAALTCASAASAAPVILNELNAVGSTKYLNGGDAAADEAGGQAADVTLGRILGNGGDWFELVVTEDGLDLRGWTLEIWVLGSLDTTLVLSQAALWTQLRAGTLITVAEDQPEDASYDPDAGDWTLNLQTDDAASGVYISALSFPVNNDEWQLVIKDSTGTIQFGPSGEGISATGGVSSTETYRLEENPGAFILPTTLCYDDADTQSTFGLPNQWGVGSVQDFGPLRAGTAPTSQCDEVEGITDLAFDPDRILEVEISMLPDDYDAMRRQARRLMDVFGGACGEAPPASPYTWFPGDVTVDGTTVPNAGVRKKGFFGSPSVTKPALKIKFDEFGSEGTIYGLERLTLNNGLQDPSLLDMCLAYDLFHAAGLVAARCSFAHVTVNGNDLGIYMNVDSIKDPFLVRNFGSAAGNLYEGTTADFRENWIGVFEKKNNDDGSELNAVAEALLIEDDAQFLAALQTV
ncbi:MAG: CotH kinase family protein, partial [Myxococcota bacterium]